MSDNNLFLALMIVGYVILAMLTICVVIKIASVYARFKGNKRGSGIELKDNRVLAVAQEDGETTVLCKKIELPADAEASAVVVDDGEEA